MIYIYSAAIFLGGYLAASVSTNWAWLLFLSVALLARMYEEL